MQNNSNSTLSNPEKKYKIISIDYELTGFNPGYDEFLKILIINEKKEIIFNKTFKPQKRTHQTDYNAHFFKESKSKSKASPFSDSREEIEKICNQSEIILASDIYGTLIPMFDYNDVKLNSHKEILDPSKLFYEYCNELGYECMKYKPEEYLELASIKTWDEAKGARLNLEMYQTMIGKFNQLIQSEISQNKMSNTVNSIQDEEKIAKFSCGCLLVLLFFIIMLLFK